METLFAWAETLGNPLETLLETLETPSETLSTNPARKPWQIITTAQDHVWKKAFWSKRDLTRVLQNRGGVHPEPYICNMTQNNNREHTAVCSDLPVRGHPNTCHHAAQREHSFLRQQKTESKMQHMRSGDRNGEH